MADTKISALTAATAAAAANELAINEAGTSKKVTADQLEYLFGIRKTTLASAYSNGSTTGTEVSDLSFTSLTAGTYYVKWMLLMQSIATTTAPKFGVNYTGTVTRMNMVHHFPSAGVNAATGAWEDENNPTTGAIWAYMNTRTETTTAPNLGPGTGVTVADVDHYCDVEGIVVVSDTGDLELWAGTEVATSQITLSKGSSGMLIRF